MVVKLDKAALIRTEGEMGRVRSSSLKQQDPHQKDTPKMDPECSGHPIPPPPPPTTEQPKTALKILALSA